MKNQPLRNLFKAPATAAPLTDYTIGIDTTERMLEKVIEKPWPIYKIKVGTPDDLEKLRAIRAHTQARLRVDANAGWSLETAVQLLPILQELGVELVEQPLAKDDGINIKLTKCSGITPARRMIANARKLNLQIMLGSMNESSVGTAALAHLLPFVDLADLDGPLLLDEDLAAGLSYDQGNVLLSEGSGLGVQVNL
jgi:L-alanine-DL-glutamate epimerase-like enolase superfamily enzyme